MPIDEIMDAAMGKYFSGIADDFCAFIEIDFFDTESRRRRCVAK